MNQTTDYYGNPLDVPGYQDVFDLMAKAFGPKRRVSKPKRWALLLAKSMPSDNLPAKPELTIKQQLQLVDDAVATGRLSGHDGMQAQALLKSGHPLTAGFLAALGG
ncbi:hypothetical protein [Azotobacter beijerinckii]|uniref:hypothetical protein n=1 Tax=Azotobacter beijerinckii TaxID=170623 RepID=UPI002954EF5D|nr:hypothetical protein [Azotobacter beijerinckii]MDV7210771.1 hypothetical protein [Azotobacter beijerinckii]